MELGRRIRNGARVYAPGAPVAKCLRRVFSGAIRLGPAVIARWTPTVRGLLDHERVHQGDAEVQGVVFDWQLHG